jgi:hypothetical protein
MRIKIGLVAVALLAVGLSGCGHKKGNDGVATAGGAVSTSASAQPDNAELARKFAQCLREHGIDVADPEDGKIPMLPQGVDPEKAKAASDACRQYAPTMGGDRPPADAAQLEQMRKVAQCMRDNGFPNFPDPGPDGNLGFGPGSGIDPKDPKLQEATRKCQQLGPQPSPSGGLR